MRVKRDCQVVICSEGQERDLQVASALKAYGARALLESKRPEGRAPSVVCPLLQIKPGSSASLDASTTCAKVRRMISTIKTVTMHSNHRRFPMKTSKITALLAVSLLAFASARGASTMLFPVIENNRWGFVDKSGTLVIN